MHHHRRYDYSAEDDVGILTENGGQPMFFGATRQDRASALRTTMAHHNWTAATILHQSRYGPDDGVSCVTLKQRYGCECTQRTTASLQTPSTAGTAGTAGEDRAEDRIRFWCINVENGTIGGGLEEVFKTLEDHEFYKTEINSFIKLSRLNSSRAISVPNVVVLALRNQTLLRSVLSKGNALGMMTTTNSTTSKGWDPEKHPKNPKVWIVYESELLSTVKDYLQEVSSSGCWVLGLGRLSNPMEKALHGEGDNDDNLENGGQLEHTSNEQMITAYEASIGFAYGLDGVYNLLLALDPVSRRVKLKNSQTVHGSQAENVKIQLSARPLAMDYTGL